MPRRNVLNVLPCIALLAVFTGSCAPARAEADGKPEAIPKITLEQFEEMRAEPDAIVIDVRSPEEFAAGHIPGAVNVPLAAGDFDERVATLDKEKKYLVHCAVGVRSERACKKMAGTVKGLFNFSGGMAEWKKAGKPVDKGDKVKG